VIFSSNFFQNLHINLLFSLLLFQPLSAADLEEDFEYADVTYRENYGPINYKSNSIYASVNKQKNGALK
jgi:hypothetical protein